MMGLWADGWFYISTAGLLISGVLFFFLLGQYRAASEAADVTEVEQGADKEAVSPSPIRPVYIPDEPANASIASHSSSVPEPKPETKVPETKPGGEYPGPERRRDAANTTGGISPAVVYLQNIKGELANLHGDLRALAKRVDDELSAVSTRDEALIERLGELTRAVESMKNEVPVAKSADPSPTPSPKKARKDEKVPEPVVEVVLETAAPVSIPEPVIPPPPAPELVPAPKTEAVQSPDETIRMELGALIAGPSAVEPKNAPAQEETAPAPAVSAEASPEEPPEEKPRRGPVWPV